MKKNLLLLAAAGLSLGVSAQSVSFEDGYYVICEGNYSTDPGYIHYYNPTTAEMQFDLVSTVNSDITLGKTAQFADLDDEVLYVTSKQAIGDNGYLLAVLNSRTLELIKGYTALPTGGDGRGVAISDKGYAFVATTAGINMFTASTGEFLSSVEVSASDVGDLVTVDNLLYVATNGALLVYSFDSTGLNLESTIEISGITTVFKLPNGSVYAAVNTCTWGTPSTSDTEQFIPITGTSAGTAIDVTMASMNTWFAIQSVQPVASLTANEIYYSPASLTSFISKYNFDTDTFTQEFITLPDGHQFYSHTLNVDPNTGDVVAATFSGYASTDYWLDIFDGTTGELKNTYTWTNGTHYWFPCKVLNTPASTSTGIDEVVAKQVGEVYYVNLAGMKSSTPFSGMNIVVTRYTDGSTSSIKVVK